MYDENHHKVIYSCAEFVDSDSSCEEVPIKKRRSMYIYACVYIRIYTYIHTYTLYIHPKT